MTEVQSGLKIFYGSVNTVLLERNAKKLLIDSGEMPAPPDGGAADWALFTHHHRDQASAAWQLSAAGSKIGVPLAEKGLFDAVQEFWDSDAYGTLDYRALKMRPTLFTIRDSVPVTRALKGGDVLEWEGLRLEVLDTPGHTDGSITYFLESGGERIAFVGDLIYGPGQIWEVYNLQRRFPGMEGDYWGFGETAQQLKSSLDAVLSRKPDLLIPSHGVLMKDPPEAVAAMKRNLDALISNYLVTAAWRFYKGFEGIYPRERPPRMLPALPPVPYPKWLRHISPVAAADATKAIVADDGSVFLSDCGSLEAVAELARLQKAGQIGKIEGIWITHYHYDHTEYVNSVKRHFGAKVYVQKQMADIIENPRAYNMPCLYPEPIKVDHAMEDGETMEWKGFKLTAFYFPGQTLYHDGLLVERQGFRAFFTGDSFANWGIDDYCSENRNFLGPHVGYEKCLSILSRLKPDILVAAHWGPQPISQDYVQKTVQLLQARRVLYRKLLPHDEPNFGIDPYWVRTYPYRQTVLAGAEVQLDACILNHGPHPKHVRVALHLPTGWQTVSHVISEEVPARTEGRMRLAAIAPKEPRFRRYVLGVWVEVDGRPWGEVSESIVDLYNSGEL